MALKICFSVSKTAIVIELSTENPSLKLMNNLGLIVMKLR